MLVAAQPRGMIVKVPKSSVVLKRTSASRSTLNMAEEKFSPRTVLLSPHVKVQKIPSVQKLLLLISLVISPVAMTKTTVTRARSSPSVVSYFWHAHRRH